MPTGLQLNRPSPDNYVAVQEDIAAVVAGLKGRPDSWKTFTLLDGRKFAVKPDEVKGITEVADPAT